jgi:hypothetical protein
MGPVPAKYQLVVWVCGLSWFAVLGILLAPALPASVIITAAVSLAIGALAVPVYLRELVDAQR